VTIDPVPAGDYTFTAAAWSACTDPNACTGTPDLTATARATVPGATEVVVTFQ
jgi:hypothetical protein